MDDLERFDVFAVDHLTHGHPLETVALAMLQRFDLIAKLGLRQEPVRKFFQASCYLCHDTSLCPKAKV